VKRVNSSEKTGAIYTSYMCIGHRAIKPPYAQGQESLSLYWGNDGTFLKPNDRADRHYTDGLKVVFTHQPDCNFLRAFGNWNNFAEGDEDVNTAVGYFAAHHIYTPDHVGRPGERGDTDRVFAGWLYGGIFAQRAKTNEMEHFELNMGVIGPSSQADEVQRIVHDLVRAEAPMGWEHQLDDEFAVDFMWFKKQRFDIGPIRRTSNFDTHLEYGFTAGSVHRNANLGLTVRIGGKVSVFFLLFCHFGFLAWVCQIQGSEHR